MIWCLLAQIVSTLLELVLLHHQTERHKDLQILLLRRQLDLVTRKLDQPPPISRAEKFILALLAFKLKRATQWTAKQFKEVLRIFRKPSSSGIGSWYGASGPMVDDAQVDDPQPA